MFPVEICATRHSCNIVMRRHGYDSESNHESTHNQMLFAWVMSWLESKNYKHFESWVNLNKYLWNPLESWVDSESIPGKPVESWVESIQVFKILPESWADSNQDTYKCPKRSTRNLVKSQKNVNTKLTESVPSFSSFFFYHTNYHRSCATCPECLPYSFSVLFFFLNI